VTCCPRLRLAVAAVFAAAFALTSSASADESWVRVRSPHFEVLSNAAPERARALAARLEQFRRVMATVLPASAMAPPAETPTIVVAFRDQGSFGPFLPVYRGRTQDVDGYFQAGSDRDYIALSLGSVRDDPFETAYHEYAHVVLNRTLSAQPLWIGEGLAEVFARWETAPGQVLVGQPAPDHLHRLRREKPLPLSRLVRVDYTSRLYNEGKERGVFYAQSWALAHWALLGRGSPGPADLQAFLSAVASGADPERAFAAAFGADVTTVERLLPSYLAGPLPVARFDAPAIEVEIAVESDVPRKAEVEYRLADLLIHGGRLPEARRRLERAIEADPRFAPAHQALGHVALRQGRWQEARREVALAMDADPGDAVALLRYAEMIARETSARGEVLSEPREAEVVATLERALSLDPHLADACEMLARLRPQPYALRIRQVSAALARDPGRASLGLMLASLHAKRNDYAAARTALIRTRTLARDEAHRFLSDHLLARLDRATAGTAEVKGRLVSLDCRPGGVLRFVIEGGPAAAGGPLRLEASSADGIFLYGPDGVQVERTLFCGSQGILVTARYRPRGPGPAHEPDGTLISLTFDAS
jgi:tetratricopeptide (TPR) repeat protein